MCVSTYGMLPLKGQSHDINRIGKAEIVDYFIGRKQSPYNLR